MYFFTSVVQLRLSSVFINDNATNYANVDATLTRRVFHFRFQVDDDAEEDEDAWADDDGVADDLANEAEEAGRTARDIEARCQC